MAIRNERNGRLRVAIVASQFNKIITSRLVDGARHALQRHGVRPTDIATWWVPGAVELPVAANLVEQAVIVAVDDGL